MSEGTESFISKGEVSSKLFPNEQILWRGNPSASWRLAVSKLLALPHYLILSAVAVGFCIAAFSPGVRGQFFEGNDFAVRACFFFLAIVLALLVLRRIRNLAVAIAQPIRIHYLITDKRVIIDESNAFGELISWPIEKAAQAKFVSHANSLSDAFLIREVYQDAEGRGVDKCVFYGVRDLAGLKKALASADEAASE